MRRLLVTALALTLLIAPSLQSRPTSISSSGWHVHAMLPVTLRTLLDRASTALVPHAQAAYGCGMDFNWQGGNSFRSYGYGYRDVGESLYLYSWWGGDGADGMQWTGTAGSDGTFDDLEDFHTFPSGGYYWYVEVGSNLYGYCAWGSGGPL